MAIWSAATCRSGDYLRLSASRGEWGQAHLISAGFLYVGAGFMCGHFTDLECGVRSGHMHAEAPKQIVIFTCGFQWSAAGCDKIEFAPPKAPRLQVRRSPSAAGGQTHTMRINRAKANQRTSAKGRPFRIYSARHALTRSTVYRTTGLGGWQCEEGDEHVIGPPSARHAKVPPQQTLIPAFATCSTVSSGPIHLRRGALRRSTEGEESMYGRCRNPAASLSLIT